MGTPRCVEIDLSVGAVRPIHVPDDIAGNYPGGRGLAGQVLPRYVGRETEPLGEENVLIFAPGLLTGSQWPNACSFTMTAKSPLTQAYGTTSSTGFFGPALKKAGLDLVVVTGRAASPSVILADERGLHVLSATDLWGLDTNETAAELEQRYPGACVAVIGPAGENLVRFASVVHDRDRCVTRGGVGAVMGSKNLKAFVVRDAETERNESPEFVEASALASEKIRENVFCQRLTERGTATLVGKKNSMGDLPTKNHKYGQFPFADGISAEAVLSYVKKRVACYNCVMPCLPKTVIPQGPYKTELIGPEFEPMALLGSNCWNGDLEALIYLYSKCSRLGIDPMSAGVVLAYAMESTEQGLLQDEEAIVWGDAERMISLLDEIATRQGAGRFLSDGVRMAAQKLGNPDSAMHVKGMEMGGQQVRVTKAFGLGHAVGSTGADPWNSLPLLDVGGLDEVAKRLFPQFYPEIMDVEGTIGKPEMLVYTENLCAILDTLGMCKFPTVETYALEVPDLAEACNLYGWETNTEGLLRMGAEIIDWERAINREFGLTRADDTLPRRFTEDPLFLDKPKDKGRTLDLEPMLEKYYALRGWGEDGMPEPKVAKEW